MQDINLYQMKLKVKETLQKDEKTNTKFEPVRDENVVTKSFPDIRLTEAKKRMSNTDKDYKETGLRSKKETEVEVLFGKAVKTTMKKLYDLGMFNIFEKANEVLKLLTD